MLGEDLLTQALERERRARGDEAVEPLPERLEQALFLRRQSLRQRALEPGEQRPLPRGAAQQHEGVVRHADERRREHGDERLVVVPIVQQAEIHEQVGHLLLAEVAAAGLPVGGQAQRTELLLVPLRVGAGGEQQDDLARRCRARIHELAHAPRDVPRLPAPPVRAAPRVRRLVGDEQLDGRAENGIRKLTRGRERLKLAAEVPAEQVVDRREHLGP